MDVAIYLSGIPRVIHACVNTINVVVTFQYFHWARRNSIKTDTQSRRVSNGKSRHMYERGLLR